MLKQWKRVKQNIFAFIILGLIAGIIIGKGAQLVSSQIVQVLLAVGDLKLDPNDLGNKLLTENIAPVTLTFLWVIILMFSTMHRVIHGVRDKPSFLLTNLIAPLEELGSLLAVAWLGVQLGMVVPVWVCEGPRVALAWLFLCAMPLLYLFEMACFMALISKEGIFHLKWGSYEDEREHWLNQTRLEGALMFACACGILIYQHHIDSWLKSLPGLALRHS